MGSLDVAKSYETRDHNKFTVFVLLEIVVSYSHISLQISSSPDITGGMMATNRVLCNVGNVSL